MSQPNSKFQYLTPLSILLTLVAFFYIFKNNPLLMTEETLAAGYIYTENKDQSPIPLAKSQKPRSKKGFEHSYQFKENEHRDSVLNDKWRWERRFTLVSQRDYALDIELSTPPLIAKDDFGFFMASDGKLLASKMDGRFLWSFQLEKNSFDHIPTLTQKYVFASTQNGDIYAIEKETGHLIWILPTQMKALQSIVVVDNNLFFFGQSRASRTSPQESPHLVKINALNGSIVWTSTPLSSVPSSMAALDRDKNLMIVGTIEGQVLALNLENGDIRWTAYTRGPIKGAPMIFEDQVYIANVEAEAFAFNIESGERLWTYELSSGTNESFTRIPDTKWITISTHRGYLHTLNRKTGEGKWKYNLRNHFSSYPTYALRFRNREIEELELKWRYQGWALWTPCSDRYICFLAPESGRLLQRIPLNGVISGNIFFEKNSFYVNLKKGESDKQISDFHGITFFMDSARFKRLQKNLAAQAQVTAADN